MTASQRSEPVRSAPTAHSGADPEPSPPTPECDDSDLLAALLNGMDAALCAFDTSGTVTHWNREAERVLGWSADEAIGRHGLTGWAVRAADARPVETRLRAAMEAPGRQVDEFALLTKDGRRVLVRTQCSAVRGPDGRTAGVYCAFSEVHAQIDLERSIALSEALLSEASWGVVLIDADLRPTVVNAQAAQVLDSGRRLPLGRPLGELFEQGVEDLESALQHVLAGGGPPVPADVWVTLRDAGGADGRSGDQDGSRRGGGAGPSYGEPADSEGREGREGRGSRGGRDGGGAGGRDGGGAGGQGRHPAGDGPREDGSSEAAVAGEHAARAGEHAAEAGERAGHAGGGHAGPGAGQAGGRSGSATTDEPRTRRCLRSGFLRLATPLAEEPTPLGAAWIFQDVTEAKRQEQESARTRFRGSQLHRAERAAVECEDPAEAASLYLDFALAGFADHALVDLVLEGPSAELGQVRLARAAVTPRGVPGPCPPIVPDVVARGVPVAYVAAHPALQAVERGGSVRTSAARTDEPAASRWAAARKWPEGSVHGLCCVLRSRGRTLGVATFLRGASRRGFDRADAAYAEDVAARVAAAVDLARQLR